MVQDLSYNLCESLVENIDGVSGATSRKVVVATPVITLTDNSVTITCDTTGATIYYTLDGSTPTSSSSQYSSAFTLDSSCTIKAIAIKGGKSSGVAEESYVKPITYLTQWTLVGNSEVHGQEIWSCGEYSAVDGKYHILVQPQGGSIADIALTEPLRMINDIVDTIEFPSDTEGKALVTRSFSRFDMGDVNYGKFTTPTIYFRTLISGVNYPSGKVLCAVYPLYPYTTPLQNIHLGSRIGLNSSYIMFVNDDQAELTVNEFKEANAGIKVIYELATPTTELIDAPQIEEADSYTCEISQGGKAVEWSSFETE